MNFLEEKSLELDGISPAVAAQIATIMRHQIRQIIVGDPLGMTRDTIRNEARGLVEETSKKYLGSNLDVIVSATVRAYLTKELNLKKMLEDEVKKQISTIMSENLKIALNHG